MSETENTLVETKLYLQTGSHIGAKFKTVGMKKFIFKNRRDKLKVLDVATIDERLRITAKFLASFNAQEIAIVSRKQYGQKPVEKFAKLTGSHAITGRFVPGTFTNPTAKEFVQPKVLMITDPDADAQAIQEARGIRIPIIALCSTDNETKNLDLIIPINNKGRQSLALAYWILAQEFLKHKGMPAMKESLQDFEFQLKEEKKDLKPALQQATIQE
ncbi:MAG: 30S ribosomal protein S2 [Candidatus Diapherotrites archaeon]|nr:30S ribosomal protein S2 [Candidatus Diapherotrites archaeon]